MSPRIVAIFGPPGAGKTTAVVPLAAAMGAVVISSGNIARVVDPESLARGEMANRAKLRAGFTDALLHAARHSIVIDGLPRDPTDVELLPADVLYILLSCRPLTAIARQERRGRSGDDTVLIHKRTSEQFKLMGLDHSDGWAYRLAGRAFVDTTNQSRIATVEAVIEIAKHAGIDIAPYGVLDVPLKI